MTGRGGFWILCGSLIVLGPACATKTFVQDRISSTEAKVNVTEEKVDQLAKRQETNQRETTELARTSREASDAAERQLKRLDARVNEVGALANAAKEESESLAAVVEATEARLSHRIASRNKYRLLETRSIHFEPGQAEIRAQDAGELEYVAKVLKADSNAISELQGFADP